MPARELGDVVAALRLLSSLPPTTPATTAEAADVRARTREVDAQIGALLHPGKHRTEER